MHLSGLFALAALCGREDFPHFSGLPQVALLPTQLMPTFLPSSRDILCLGICHFPRVPFSGGWEAYCGDTWVFVLYNTLPLLATQTSGAMWGQMPFPVYTVLCSTFYLVFCPSIFEVQIKTIQPEIVHPLRSNWFLVSAAFHKGHILTLSLSSFCAILRDSDLQLGSMSCCVGLKRRWLEDEDWQLGTSRHHDAWCHNSKIQMPPEESGLP